MKRQQATMLIVMPGISQFQNVTGGLAYVSEMMAEAKLGDRKDETPVDVAWLRELLRTMRRRLGRRVLVRLLDPMTLAGLFVVIRYRIRHYPSVVTPRGHVLVHPDVEEVIQRIAEELQSSKE
jgi:hypothetical protein